MQLYAIRFYTLILVICDANHHCGEIITFDAAQHITDANLFSAYTITYNLLYQYVICMSIKHIYFIGIISEECYTHHAYKKQANLTALTTTRFVL